MRVPLSWLREFTPLTTDAADRAAVRELGRVLDSLGLVVEGVEHVGDGLDGVVLARVNEIRAIEGADRIRQVVVDAGAGPQEIVCGASNFSVGDVVPLATVGAELPGGVVIARRKMRGIVSDGMLCSGRELGLGDDASGLLVVASTGAPDAPLPGGIELGEPLATYLGIVPDAVFDLAIEPNRPDCLSILGVARDLAARLSLPFAVAVAPAATSGAPAAELGSVAVHEPAACPHLLARVLTGVSLVPSPPEVARRLVLAGMRPINSVVDASNYVMLELGQPTHPYDLDRLGGGGIAVRFARPGERLVTLDGTERVLGLHRDALGRTVEVEDLVICDARDVPVGLAGVMGGATSEITESTTRVLLEVAQFAPLVVARAAKRHGLRSEASARFERGVDPAGLGRAADRICELLASACAAAGVPGPVVAPRDLDEHPRPVEIRTVALRVERSNALLGIDLDAPAVAGLLEPIGFEVEPTGTPGTVAVTVPTFRPDVAREVDVIEEVARHYGYERIPATSRRSPYVGGIGAAGIVRRRVRRLLTGLGAHEAWTSSIVDPAVLRRAGSAAPVVTLANPMVSEESVLRAQLLPGLLESLRRNASHRNPSVRLFEVGHVFLASPDAAALPTEREHLGLLLGADGDDATVAVRAWRALADGLLLAPDAVSVVQRLTSGAVGDDGGGGDDLGDAPHAEAALLVGLHPTRRARLVVGGRSGPTLGAIGEVDPEVLEAFGLAPDRRVGWMVLDLGTLDTVARRDRRARVVSRYPSNDIDLAFVVGDEIPADALERVLATAAGELCESIRVVDVYRGPGVEPGTRSIASRLRFRAADRTLTDAEVSELRTRCIDEATRELGAVLRG
ncbi:MAG TPA: phenylalanine--tRNA ligase subunit beta [Acidimicrobiales bacterium]|nr:phenylalanine--tRNA ligase subunit beta [Acidimicrobiales bacterium]